MIQTFQPLSRERVDGFYELHAGPERGWCSCVAWWVPDWEGFGERTAEENRALREALFARGEYDGYLAYADGRAVGWAQVGRRDRLAKLLSQFSLAPDPRRSPSRASSSRPRSVVRGLHVRCSNT
jgi:hypothetical protein